uniref:Zonadhesin n=1 Tax=Romanomermis culicivorax TaxID=13658 RepID=A0A915JGD9_ROMCU
MTTRSMVLLLNLPHLLIFQSNTNLYPKNSIVECDDTLTNIIFKNSSTSKFPKSSYFLDKTGSEYEFRQFMGSFDFDPCSWPRKFRRKRDFESLQQYFDRAHVTIDSVNSSLTITQLVNISSDKSTITIKENYLLLSTFSDKSNVKIKPDENLVNISIEKPLVIMNSSRDQSFEMKTTQSELYVVKKSERDYSIAIESGVTNIILRQNSIDVTANADHRSTINIRNQAEITSDHIFINSKIIDRQSIIRQLNVTCYAKNVVTEIELVTGNLSIFYNQTLIEVSAKTHEIFVYVDRYAVRIATVFSSFNISITNLITINIDDATVVGYPQNNNITALVPYSLMKVWADNETTLQFGDTALTNTFLNVESRRLVFELEPSKSKVRCTSFDSLSLLNTSHASNLMLRSNKTAIEVLSGIPRFLILTGNTSIELKSSSSKWISVGSGSFATVQPTIGFQGEQDTSKVTVPGDTDHSIALSSRISTTAVLLHTTVIPTVISMSSEHIAQKSTDRMEIGSTAFKYSLPFTYPVEVPEPFPDSSTATMYTTAITAESVTSAYNTVPPLPNFSAFTSIASLETTTPGHTVQITTPTGFTCIRSTLNPSSDVVCIEAEITSIQVPPMNSTITISQEATLVPYQSTTGSVPIAHENSENFIITQYSVATIATPITRPLLPAPTINVGNATVDEIIEHSSSTAINSESRIIVEVSTVATAVAHAARDEITGRESSVPSPIEREDGNGNFTERKLSKRYVLMQNPPEDKNILSVALRVKRSIQLNSDEFLEPIKKGLEEAYVEGKNRRLGINQKSRIRRQSEAENRASSKNGTKMNVELISVDRPNVDKAIIRFFVVDGSHAVDAAKAKETYNQLDSNELSALITHPVLSLEHHSTNANESVELIESVPESAKSDFPSETILVVVILVSLGLILLATALALIFHKKHKKCCAETERRDSVVSEQQRARISGQHETSKSLHARLAIMTNHSVDNTGRVFRETGKFTSQTSRTKLVSLPTITNKVLNTSKDLSPSEMLSFYISILGNELAQRMHEHINFLGLTNKVCPTDKDAKDMINNRDWPPSIDYLSKGTGIISPNSRRKIAQNLLDRSFPLENVQIEDVLADRHPH